MKLMTLLSSAECVVESVTVALNNQDINKTREHSNALEIAFTDC